MTSIVSQIAILLPSDECERASDERGDRRRDDGREFRAEPPGVLLVHFECLDANRGIEVDDRLCGHVLLQPPLERFITLAPQVELTLREWCFHLTAPGVSPGLSGPLGG